MAIIKQALDIYSIYDNKYPTSSEGLSALVEKPSSVKKWQGPYVRKPQLKDAWGTKFGYKSDGRKFKIISAGKDKVFETDDDLFFR